MPITCRSELNEVGIVRGEYVGGKSGKMGQIGIRWEKYCKEAVWAIRNRLVIGSDKF